VVAAVEGEDGVGERDEEGEGDERRDDEGLRVVWVSLCVLFSMRVFVAGSDVVVV
jgi:hypothetical protein